MRTQRITDGKGKVIHASISNLNRAVHRELDKTNNNTFFIIIRKPCLPPLFYSSLLPILALVTSARFIE
jgi:hypothetical protein